MKLYHLRFTENDFVSKTSDILDDTNTRYTWRTDVFDLYFNSQYKNYTVKRVGFGTNLLNNGVYTGLNQLSATESEIGFVDSGRFVDTSARIDIMDWKVSFDTSISSAVGSKLSVYTSDFSDSTPYYLHATPSMVSDWSVQENIILGRNVFNIESSRYAFFELIFDLDSTILVDGKSIEMIIAVEIDPPVTNGYFASTKKIQDKFPQWMALREHDPDDPLKEDKATPISVGGEFLNAIAGEWLTDLTQKIKYQEYQYYIDTVDLDQKAWIYITQGVPDIVWSITGDGISLAKTSSVEEFYASQDDDNACYWSRATDEIFTNILYDELLINGTKVYQKPYHIWNGLDDLGVSVDLFRIQSATPNGYLEDNDSFRKRILDVYINNPGVSKELFKKTLRRELNLWRYSNATPDSAFLGATPEVIEISDIENDEDFFVDGIPTQKFKDLVQELAIKYPMTWGFFKYGNAFWDADGFNGHKGFDTLPRQLDATPVSQEYLESGVGDGNDLYVFRPREVQNKYDFNTTLKIKGRKKTLRSEHIPLSFAVQIYGTAANAVWDNPVLQGYFTIELSVYEDGASPTQHTFYCNVTATAKSDVDYYTPTPSPASRALIEWTTPDGYTDIGFDFKNKSTGVSYGSQIPLPLVSAVNIYPGHFNGDAATPAYMNAPTQSDYKAWFDGEPGTIMGLDGGTSLTKSPYTWWNHFGAFWFESHSTNYLGATPDTWQTEKYTYNITLNGVMPDMTAQDYVLTLPNFVWPASTSSRLIKVDFITNYNLTTFGAYSDAVASTPIFIPNTYIAVDGNTTWTDDYYKTFSAGTTSLTFSTTSGAAYPVNIGVWEIFESSIVTPISGTVDASGPWRNGKTQDFNSSDYLLDNLELTRADFNIPETEDYILTWIGVESVDEPNVIVWLETNTIKPAVVDYGETDLSVQYPSTVNIEIYDPDTLTYNLSTLRIFCRLRPNINQKWNPKLHSGWFYDDTDEYYLYASPNTEQATGSYKVLSDLNRQGAPIIIKAIDGATPIAELRQTSFFNYDSATPLLSIDNTERITGNDTAALKASYQDIRDITIVDTTTNSSLGLIANYTLSNEIQLATPTISIHEYDVNYIPNYSYYIDNDFVDSDGLNKTKVFFDRPPGEIGADYYKIEYEVSIYDSATPADIELNPNETFIDDGFIYIDHDIYDLDRIDISISPTKIVSDGIDYAIVTVKTTDINGNPKPYQSLNVFTNFGSLSDDVVITDNNGFTAFTLQSNIWTPATPAYPSTPALAPATPGTLDQGIILVEGDFSTTAKFDIEVIPTETYSIYAIPDSDYILADPENANFVYGKVTTSGHDAVSNAYVYWRKGRTIYEVFNIDWDTSSATPGLDGIHGRVVADQNGRFSIGPFNPSDTPGYWFVSTESESASPSGTFTTIGDLVYWYEYPDVTNSIDLISGLPLGTEQSSTPYWNLPEYTATPAFPTTYDELVLEPGLNEDVIIWTPPSWYAIDKYTQYQMGILGTTYDSIAATPQYPDYKEF